MMTQFLLRACLALLFCGCVPAQAVVVINSSLPAKYQITVRLVQASNTDGDSADVLGNDTTRAYIEDQVQRILSQVGIAVVFEEQIRTVEDNFIYEGSAGANQERPIDDLNASFGRLPDSVYDRSSAIIPALFVGRVPGFRYLNDDQVAAQAFISKPGFCIFVGANRLSGGESQRDQVAIVLAHEICHNLGLEHIPNPSNLMHPFATRAIIFNSQREQVIEDRFSSLGMTTLIEPEFRFIDSGFFFSIDRLPHIIPHRLERSEMLEPESWEDVSDQGFISDGIVSFGEFYSSAPKAFYRYVPVPGGELISRPALRVSDEAVKTCGCHWPAE